MKFFTYLLILTSVFVHFSANAQFAVSAQLKWNAQPSTVQAGNTSIQRWGFEGAIFGEQYPSLPFWETQIPLNGTGVLQVQVQNARFERYDKAPSADDELLGEELVFQTGISRKREAYQGHVAFIPIIKKGNTYERLVQAELLVTFNPSAGAARGPENTTLSVLADGDIYKIAVAQNGIYKMSYDFLKNQLKISNLDNIDPRTIKLYGNGGGLVPEYLATERPDDLIENHIQVVGQEDGKFDAQDYILFYGEGPDKWKYSTANAGFFMEKNIYSTQNYYFLKIGPGNGARVQNQASISGTAYTTSAFDDYMRLEEDKTNLLYEWKDRAQGSGKKWYGDYFRVAREYEYKNAFQLPNLVTTQPVVVWAEMALRATKQSHFRVQLNGNELISDNANQVFDLDDNNRNYAYIADLNGSVSLSSSNIDLKVIYPIPAGTSDPSEGWIDFVQINARRQLIMTGSQMAFRDVSSRGPASATFNLSNASGQTTVWDITNPLQALQQETTLSGSQLSFGVVTGAVIKEFIAFDRSQGINNPLAVGKIPNQNIHGIEETDMLIIYHPDFESEVQRLAQHRNAHSGLTVSIVPIEQVYNEFSSGRLDPTAIRDFARMISERTTRFRYLLLFGDASFDPRGIYELGGNFVPVYEDDSLNPLYSFPSDDYFCIFSGTTTSNSLGGPLSLAVGRFPVKTLEEAKNTVDKVIKYDTEPANLRDWRNRLLFISDDEDFNLHIDSADAIATDIEADFPNFNVDKLYVDAFPQESTPAGDRFPVVNQAIDRNIFKGVLAMAYLGHGGPKGWAQERILNIPEIKNWENTDKLPLFITATCSFTGYDDPSFVSGGEETFLNAEGGAVALLSTVRAVYANENALLTEAAMTNLFTPIDNAYPTIGEAMQHAKNSFTSSTIITNSRKFSLIGDPAQVLAVARYGVATTKINNQELTAGAPDTLRALQRVTIEGVVTGANGEVLNNFNGVVYPTIYDKSTTVTTLAQDETSEVRTFSVRRNILFKGRASVRNGVFQFTFVMPKDINYAYGSGKISYYAADESQMLDAAGKYNEVIIGGTNPDGFADDSGPQVDVYLNTEDFAFGGITNNKPVLLVKLADDNGINVAGNSIGHDLEGVLDDDTENSLLLNDFYESELDDYTKGTVRYPLSKLAEGRHHISVKAWDVSNNSGDGYTEFIVTSSEGIALEQVLNYPNPFTDRTCFQFDHNMPNQQLDVLVQIYTVSGRLVKTLESNIFSDGALRRDDCISWDGRDDYGDRLARGVYLYKVKVRAGAGSATLQGESEFEKLVILK